MNYVRYWIYMPNWVLVECHIFRYGPLFAKLHFHKPFPTFMCWVLTIWKTFSSKKIWEKKYEEMTKNCISLHGLRFGNFSENVGVAGKSAWLRLSSYIFFIFFHLKRSDKSTAEMSKNWITMVGKMEKMLERLENLLGCVCLPVTFSKPCLLHSSSSDTLRQVWAFES